MKHNSKLSHYITIVLNIILILFAIKLVLSSNIYDDSRLLMYGKTINGTVTLINYDVVAVEDFKDRPGLGMEWYYEYEFIYNGNQYQSKKSNYEILIRNNETPFETEIVFLPYNPETSNLKVSLGQLLRYNIMEELVLLLIFWFIYKISILNIIKSFKTLKNDNTYESSLYKAGYYHDKARVMFKGLDKVSKLKLIEADKAYINDALNFAEMFLSGKKDPVNGERVSFETACFALKEAKGFNEIVLDKSINDEEAPYAEIAFVKASNDRINKLEVQFDEIRALRRTF